MCYSQFFLAKLLTLRILLSTVVRAAVVAKLVILSISTLNSFILASREWLVAKLVMPGILSSIFLILAYYTSFLTTSFFTTSRCLVKLTGTCINFPKFNLSTLHFKFSISNLSRSDFKLAKSTFFAKDDVSAPIAFFKSVLLHHYTNLIQLSLFLLNISVLENIHLFIIFTRKKKLNSF